MKVKMLFLIVATVLVFILNLIIGSVSIPVNDVLKILAGSSSEKTTWSYIVLDSRLPQALTALVCGGNLAICGLVLQVVFHNPLADSTILGMSSGAGLGVAFVVLLAGGSLTTTFLGLSGFILILFAAFAGAMIVAMIIVFLSSIVKTNVMLLILGIMIGYLASSAITLLSFLSPDSGVKSFSLWGMGSFSGVSGFILWIFFSITLFSATLLFCMTKHLNAMLMGDEYAYNLGINVRMSRNILLVVVGLMTSVATACCGPIAFIGLAVPHICRMIVSSDNNARLLPPVFVMGMLIALTCNLVCVLPGDNGVIPINAVTPLMGAPVIVYVLLKKRM